MMRTLAFGIEPQDKRRIEQAAQTAGLSVSEWCRTHILAALPDECDGPNCRGPGWYTIRDSGIEEAPGYGKRQALWFRLQPDGYIADLIFRFHGFHGFHGFRGLRPDMYGHSVFARLLLELDKTHISNSTELHGQRMSLPRLWVGGKPTTQTTFGTADIDYILNGACPECELPSWAQVERLHPVARLF